MLRVRAPPGTQEKEPETVLFVFQSYLMAGTIFLDLQKFTFSLIFLVPLIPGNELGM